MLRAFNHAEETLGESYSSFLRVPEIIETYYLNKSIHEKVN